MSARRFCLGFVMVLALFVGVNGVVWWFFTSKILARHGDAITGDLARMGYIADLIHPRVNRTDLPRRHLDSSDYQGQDIDLITLGDSFSQGAGGGLNRYYQDHIATRMGWRVLNLQDPPASRGPVETAAALADSGFLRRAHVRYLLLESTQRKVIERLSDPSHLTTRLTRAQLEAFWRFGQERTPDFNFALPKTPFINNGNLKFLAYQALYPLDPCAFISDACRVRLDTPLFSIGRGDEMLYYVKDERSIKGHTRANVERLNATLNALAARLRQEGVTLIFMPAVSKYDLYWRHFQGVRKPPDPLFDLLRQQRRDYLLLDTKAILGAGVEAGERDIFYVDDTHWATRASERIAQALQAMLHAAP
jgi:hypothetical protein